MPNFTAEEFQADIEAAHLANITIRSGYQLQPLWKVRMHYKFYFIFRFGAWEMWHEGMLSKLFCSENDGCPAVGIPVPGKPIKNETPVRG